jgi:hypothetical protein
VQRSQQGFVSGAYCILPPLFTDKVVVEMLRSAQCALRHITLARPIKHTPPRVI